MPSAPIDTPTARRPAENQRFAGGTSFAMRRAMNLRCYVVEYHGENRATFECPQGHRFRMNLMKRAPNGKLPSEDMLRKMAHWWNRPQGVRMDCRWCPNSDVRVLSSDAECPS
jgi:hypothetical protein